MKCIPNLVLLLILGACAGNHDDALGSTITAISSQPLRTAADCPVGTQIIEGTPIDDVLTGTPSDDCILGHGGNDRIDGRQGNDVVFGGEGDDALDGAQGADQLFGETDNDELDGGPGDDLLDGGDGNDLLDAGYGNDNLAGGEGDDRVSAGPGNDVLLGGGGADELDGGNGSDAVDGGDGDDVLTGGNGEDYLAGGAGNDVNAGGLGSDAIDGGGGNDVIDGGDGADSIQGGDGDDVILGDPGDSVDGGDGSDACAGAGCEGPQPDAPGCADDSGCPSGQRCNVITGLCLYCLGDSECDDELFCNGVESCSPTVGCSTGAPPQCDGGICDESGDRCTSEPAECGDGACTGLEDEASCFDDCFVPMLAFAGDKNVDNVLEVFMVGTGGSIANVSAPLSAMHAASIRWSPDGKWLAFVAVNASGVVELFAMPARGGVPVNISGNLVANGDVVDFAWAPDSTRIAYTADQDLDDQLQLYTSLPTGAGNVLVSGPLVAGGSVRGWGYAWSPDSTRIGFLADKSTDEMLELFAADPMGITAPTKLSGALVANGDVMSFAWSPDSARVAYVATADSINKAELYTSLADGGGNTKVSGAMIARGGVSRLAWSPDSSRIGYIANQEVELQHELYTSLAAGGDNVKLSEPLAADGNVVALAWAPDSTRVAFRTLYPDRGELFTSLATGGGATKLSDVSGALAHNGYQSPLAWSPDSMRITYWADQDVVGKYEIFSQLAAGGGLFRVSGPLASGDVGSRFTPSPDGTRIAYVAVEDNGVALYIAMADGTGTVNVSGPSSVWLSSVAWSPDSARVAYLATQDTFGLTELYSSLVTGGGSIKLSGPLVANGNVGEFAWAPMP